MLNALHIIQMFFCDGEKNPYFGHSVRTGDYLTAMFEVIYESGVLRPCIRRYRRDTVILSGLFHDIGKLCVPEQILVKNQTLTVKELDIIRRHSMYGGGVLSHSDVCTTIKNIWPSAQTEYIVDTAIYHHERVDGKGYPFGVSKHIPLLARLCAVADTFDAITSDRPYRKGASVRDAIEIIAASAGTQLDQEIVDVLLKNLKWTMPVAVCEQYVEKGEIVFGNYQENSIVGNTQTYVQCGNRGVYCNPAH